MWKLHVEHTKNYMFMLCFAVLGIFNFMKAHEVPAIWGYILSDIYLKGINRGL